MEQLPGKYRKHYEVIVVLGAALRKDGQPSPALRRRVLPAVDLVKKGKANFLLLTGGLSKYRPS
jgi:vancomycin permeability regulator SanA